MARTFLALSLFLFATHGWAADPSPTPSTAAQPPAPLAADQKAQILKLQRDLAFVDLDEQKTIDQVKAEATKKRTELQQQLQQLVSPLISADWSLDRDLNFVATKPAAKEE